MVLFIDTETTGLTSLSFANERNYKQWPRLVQVAWGCSAGGPIESMSTSVIRPDGFIIPTPAELIHGIGQERAQREGTDLIEQLRLLDSDLRKADKVVAHNIRFDLGVLKSEAIRSGFPLAQPRTINCTAFMGKAYYRKGKKCEMGAFPRLSHLYRDLFGTDYTPCHEAQSDVTACARVYFELKKLGF